MIQIPQPQAHLAEARLELMRRLLRERGMITVANLCDELGTSPATVRRDLTELERRGHARRVHGGAVAPGGRLDELRFDDKAGHATDQKRRIAARARQLVARGESVYLDGGSTVLALAQLLADMRELSVVTNSLRVAALLAGDGPRMYVVGGELRRRSQTFVGPMTRPLIEKVHFDTAFMGTLGVSAEEGLTTTDAGEAHTKELVIAHARRVVLLADAGKINAVSFVRFGTLADVDVLITDQDAPRKDLRLFRKAGVEVITA